MISFSDDSDVTDSKVSSSARICRSLKVNSYGTAESQKCSSEHNFC